MPDRPAIPPWLGLALAVVSVSFAAPLFRLADAPALTASFWRLAFAVLLLAPFFPWRTWRPFSGKEWRLMAIAGVALGAHFSLWVASLFLTTVAASVSLVTLQAIFVSLGGHFFLGDRLSRRAWTGVFLATAGAITIAATDGTLAPDSGRAVLGDVLAVLGGMGSAAYMLIGRRVRATRGLVEYVTPVYAIAALSVALAMPVVTALGSAQPFAVGVPDRSFVFFVLLATVPMLGGHTLANWCFRYMEAHVVATWILLEPVGAAILAWPLLGEVPPHPIVVVGGALVLAGAMQTVRRSRQAEAVMAAD